MEEGVYNEIKMLREETPQFKHKSNIELYTVE